MQLLVSYRSSNEDVPLINNTLWTQAINFQSSLSSHQHIIHPFLYDDLKIDSVESLFEVKVDKIHCSSIIYQAMKKAISLVKRDYPLLNLCWLLPVILHFFMSLEMVPRINYFVTFPEMKVRGLFFLPSWCGAQAFCFSPNWCGHSKVLKSIFWNQTAPSAFVNASSQGSWTHLCPLWTMVHLPCSGLSQWSLRPGIPKGWSC